MKCMRLYRGNDVYPLTNVSNWCVTSDISGSKSMQFDIAPQDDIYRYIEEEGRIEYDSTYYNIKSINERRTVATITAEIDLDGLRGKIFQKFKTETLSLSETLEKALDGTGWEVNGVGLVSAKRSIDMTDCTPLDIVNYCTNTTVFNVSFDIDNINKILNVSVPSKSVSDVYFTDELNLKELNFKGSSSNFATRLYAYGKDGMSFASINGGKEYIDNNDYSDKVIATVWRDERYTVKSSLLADAEEKLREMAVPERSYTCNVIDLARLNKQEYADFNIRVNSIITLIDRNRKKRIEHTVVELKEYPNEPINNTVVLSTKPEKVSKKLTNTNIQLSDISSTVNKQPSQWEQAIKTATALITGASGGYVVLNPSENPQEILIMNTDDINTATKVWRWNSGGLGYSANGYNGPYTTAITMDGRIVADFITAGGMSAERINAGTLQGVKIIGTTGSIAGWTMDNGVLVSSDGTMRIDSNNNTIDIYSDSNKLMTLNKNGIRFWRNGKEIGNIGVTKGANTDTWGITFNLVDGDAMTWSVFDESQQVYVNKLRYTEENGLVINNNFRANQLFGHSVVDINLGDGKHAWGYVE